MGDREDQPVAQPPTDWGRNLRCCMVCRLAKTFDQFLEQGCENCPYLHMENDRERVYDCTTTEFQVRRGGAGRGGAGQGGAGRGRAVEASKWAGGWVGSSLQLRFSRLQQPLLRSTQFGPSCACTAPGTRTGHPNSAAPSARRACRRAWWRWWTQRPAGVPSGRTCATLCRAATRWRRPRRCRSISR